MTDYDPVSKLGALVRTAVRGAFGEGYADVDPAVRPSEHADLQADVALGLARRLKKAPRAVAQELAGALSTAAPDFVAAIDIAGAGFLNVTVRTSWLAEACSSLLADERARVPLAESIDTVVIDYSSPNIAKEMHVGHLRSTVIGDALVRVLERRGHRVVRQNHLGDWGTPFGMLIEHLEDLGDEVAAREVELGELGSFYRAARAKFESDPAFAERSRQRVVALQSGDPETLTRWKTFVSLSLRYLETLYAKLDVRLVRADVCGESFYNPRLLPLAAELRGNGRAVLSDGALCFFPQGFRNKEGEPMPLILQKSDQGFGYAMTDLAALRYRLHELHATRILVVVGAPQSQHLSMIFEAARELGWLTDAARVEHVAFGSVLGADKRVLKTRAGETVRLVDLLDEAVARAAAVVSERSIDLSEDERSVVARIVGIGSVKYADLSCDRVKDYMFDVDRMVSFEGNTAGYLQYAYARIRSLFRKAGLSFDAHHAPVSPVEPEERALALTLLGFGRAVAQVEASLEPHKLTAYLYAVATSFTTFYERCPVLKSATQASRLSLAKLTALTLEDGLGLLGISVPSRM